MKDKQLDHGQQNEMKDKCRTHNTTLKTKAGVKWTLQKPWQIKALAHYKVLCPVICYYSENCFLGADLQNLVNQAALKAAMDNSKVVTMDHMYWARDKVLMGKLEHF